MDNARLERYAELSETLLRYRQQGLGATDVRVKDVAREMAEILRCMTPEENALLQPPVNRQRVVLTKEVDPSTVPVAGVQLTVEGFFVKDTVAGHSERVTISGEIGVRMRDVMHDVVKHALDQLSNMSLMEILGYDDPRIEDEDAIKLFCGMKSGVLALEQDADKIVRDRDGGA